MTTPEADAAFAAYIEVSEEIAMADETPVERINRKLKKKHGFRRAERQEGAGEDPGQDEGGGDR